MKAGDAILFSGHGGFSDLIKRHTNSEYSHVAMVIPGDGPHGDRVLITESTTLVDIPDAVSHEFIKGVQIQYLSDRIWNYQGRVFWLPLAGNILPKRLDAMMDLVR